ncbi:MAG: Ig-like domain-containing protein [Kiritimatiellales bacterium]|nr:Ig-like domain-containing protein [Kiritimatiellales bacterium]
MNKKVTKFFGKANRISLSDSEKKSGIKDLKNFMHAHPVSNNGQECHTSRMTKVYAHHFGTAKKLRLSPKENAAIFTRLISFVRSNPVKKQDKNKESGFERFWAIITLFIPVTAVLLILVMTRGDVEHHPWKDQIEPKRENEQVIPSRKMPEDVVIKVIEPENEVDEINTEESDIQMMQPNYDEIIEEVFLDPSSVVVGGDHPIPTPDQMPESINLDLGKSSIVEDIRQNAVVTESITDDGEVFLQSKTQQGELGELDQDMVPLLATEQIVPEFKSFYPVKGAINVRLNVNLILTFSEPVMPNMGSVLLRKVSDSSIVDSVSVRSLQVTGGGTSSITIDLARDLAYGTAYYIEVAANAFVDSDGNFSSEIKGSDKWSFITLEKQ